MQRFRGSAASRWFWVWVAAFLQQTKITAISSSLRSFSPLLIFPRLLFRPPIFLYSSALQPAYRDGPSAKTSNKNKTQTWRSPSRRRNFSNLEIFHTFATALETLKALHLRPAVTFRLYNTRSETRGTTPTVVKPTSSPKSEAS